jgi:PAS domain S-box-containing protein
MSPGFPPGAHSASFDNAIVGIVEIGADGRILHANDFVRAALELSEGESLERQFVDLVHRDDLGLVQDHLASAFEKAGARLPTEARVKTKRGAYLPMAIHARASPSSGNQALIVFLTALAPLRKAERALESAVQHAALLEMSIGSALGHAIEARDPYTAGHQDKVCLLAGRIADLLGFAPRSREAAVQAAAVHDVGKIGVPVEFLVKPSKLTDLEFSVIRTHPRQGYVILKELPTDLPIAQIVYEHHERCDGSGYPQGLKGEAISVESSIVAAADIIDAVVRPRPYRAAMTTDAVVSILSAERGTGLPADVADAAIQIARSGS